MHYEWGSSRQLRPGGNNKGCLLECYTSLWPFMLWGFTQDNTQISRLLSKVCKVMGRKPSCGAATARLLIEFCSASCGESFLFSEVTFKFLFYSWNQMIYLLNCLHSWCSRPYSLLIIRLRYWKHIQMTLRIMFLWLKLQWKHKSLCFLDVVLLQGSIICVMKPIRSETSLIMKSQFPVV